MTGGKKAGNFIDLESVPRPNVSFTESRFLASTCISVASPEKQPTGCVRITDSDTDMSAATGVDATDRGVQVEKRR